MRGKISTGIWLIFFGIIALLHNFNVINFNFWAILPYWPLLIIALGANLLFQNRKYSTLFLALIHIGICGFLTYIGLTSTNRIHISSMINIENTGDTTGALPNINSPFHEDIKSAKLILNLGASTLKMDSVPTNELFNAYSNNANLGLKLTSSGEDNAPVLEVNSVVKKENSGSGSLYFNLNSNPLWDLEFNIGASSFTADFSQHKIATLKVNTGAASMKFKLPMPITEENTIEINSAASSCKIELPHDAACRIEMSTLLSSRKLEGFEKKDGYYQTANYDNAMNKYNISFTGAANSLKISRY